MFRRILVPLDGSRPAQQALRPAAGLATRSGGSLALVRVIPSGAAATARRSCHAYLDGLAAQLRAKGVPVETDVLSGEPVAGIVAATRAQVADLVVMATHARSGPGRWLHGRVAEGVVRDSPVPVMLQRADAGHEGAGHRLARPTILVLLDGTVVSEAAVPVAQAFVHQLRGELLLVEAVQVPVATLEMAAIVPMDVAGDLAALSAEATAYLEGLAGRLRDAGYPTRWWVDVASPLAAVLETERWARPALVVMATPGREGLSKLVFGSLTAAVVRDSRTPVVAVPLAARQFCERTQADASSGPQVADRVGTGPG